MEKTTLPTFSFQWFPPRGENPTLPTIAFQWFPPGGEEAQPHQPLPLVRFRQSNGKTQPYQPLRLNNLRQGVEKTTLPTFALKWPPQRQWKTQPYQHLCDSMYFYI